MTASPDITRLLHRWNAGDEAARDALVGHLYEPLRDIARAHMRREASDHTLNTTGLVHEAYLKLADLRSIEWADRQHVLALLSRMMRRILIDYARARNAARRGGGQRAETLDDERLVPDEQLEAMLELDDALHRLEAEHPRAAQAVQHTYFGGLTHPEAADVLGVSLATVERDLRFARAWLARTLNHDPGAPG